MLFMDRSVSFPFLFLFFSEQSSRLKAGAHLAAADFGIFGGRVLKKKRKGRKRKHAWKRFETSSDSFGKDWKTVEETFHHIPRHPSDSPERAVRHCQSRDLHGRSADSL